MLRYACCAIVLTLLAVPAAAQEKQSNQNEKEIETLIEQLLEITEEGFGYCTMHGGTEFLPLPGTEQMGPMVLFRKPPEKSDVLRKIVEKGAAAVPVLLKHLDDDRKVGMKPVRGMMWMSFPDEYDYNRRTIAKPPRGVNRGGGNLLEDCYPDRHAITIGDLCYVALGQIVNRAFIATRYQPTGGLIVNSPTYSKALYDAVMAEWGGLTPEKHKKSLIQDFLKPNYSGRRVGAYRRLAVYYPEVLDELVPPQLTVPTYDSSKVYKFVRGMLYRIGSLRKLKKRFNRFVQENGEASAEGIMLQLFEDLRELELYEEGVYSSAPRGFDKQPRQLLILLYGKSKEVRSSDRPWPRSVSISNQTEFVKALSADSSVKIDRAVYKLLLSIKDSDKLAIACMKRLVGRGYDKDIERYIKRRLPYGEKYERKCLKEIQEKLGWTRLHAALERQNFDELKRMLKAGADVNAAARNGKTPLHIAAKLGRKNRAKLLIQQGAKLEAKDNNDQTPVQLAVRADHVEMVKFFLNRGCKVRDLLVAAFAGDTERASALIKQKKSLLHEVTDYGLTTLHIAAWHGHADMARLLLANGAEVNAQAGKVRTMFGSVINEAWTPLHFAANGGHANAVRVLLEQGADVSSRLYGDGYEPLHLAAFRSHKEVVELLIKHKAAINSKDEVEKRTPLLWAAARGHPEVVKLLLKHGADIRILDKDKHSALSHAAAGNHKAAAELLIGHGANVNAKDEFRWTVLHRAAFNGAKDAVELLISRGAQVSAGDNGDDTPLMRAVVGGHADVVRLLLKHKAGVAVGMLHTAAERGHSEVAKVLIEAGMDVNAKTRYYEFTPLHTAAKHGQEKVAGILIKGGANVNAKDEEGMTPLHLAAQYGQKKAVEVLVRHGVDINAVDKKGMTPLDLAVWESHGWVIDLLLDSKPKVSIFAAVVLGKKQDIERILAKNPEKVNLKGLDGNTPLHLAAGKGQKEIVELLIASGADVNARNERKRTPLHFAAGNGHLEVVKLLVEQKADVNARDSDGRLPSQGNWGYKHVRDYLRSKGTKYPKPVRSANSKKLQPGACSVSSTPFSRADLVGAALPLIFLAALLLLRRRMFPSNQRQIKRQ